MSGIIIPVTGLVCVNKQVGSQRKVEILKFFFFFKVVDKAKEIAFSFWPDIAVQNLKSSSEVFVSSVQSTF